MIYECLDDVRHRMNLLGMKLNAASDYGRKTLTAEFEPMNREWRALGDIYMKSSLLKDKPCVPYYDEVPA